VPETRLVDRSAGDAKPRLSLEIRPQRLWRLRRGWHQVVKPAWSAWRPFVVIALAATVLVLGTIGFNQKAGYDFWDSLYGAIQLFGFGGGATQDPNWELQIARFLGPLIVGYAAIRGLMLLFREQLQLFWFRLVLHDHVVIAGLGEVGHHVASRLSEMGAQVVAIEANPMSESATTLRNRGVPVITGNAVDRVTLRRAQVHRAAYMVVSCGHDQRDIEVAMAARRARRRSGVLTVFLSLGEPSLWRSIKVPALTEGASGSVRLEPFSLLDSAASLMVEETLPATAPGSASTVLVSGDKTISQNLALHVARVWSNAGQTGELHIELLRPGATRDRTELLERNPELASICEVSATEQSVESQGFGQQAADAAAIYVAYSDEAQGLATALALRACTRAQDVPIVLAVREESSGAAIAAHRSGIRAFGIFTQALGDKFLDRGMNEVMARAAHEEYVRARETLGETPADNPSLVAWGSLPHSLRQSNRRQVDGIGPKLAAIGCAIVPSPLVRLTDDQFEFTESELDRLAVLEHERWQRDLRDEGWRRNSGRKDPQRLRHPSLIPWERLSDEERKKDRDAVTAIPSILERAGYAIVRLTGAANPRVPQGSQSAPAA
jgi:voltage-gated potassium channel Kch